MTEEQEATATLLFTGYNGLSDNWNTLDAAHSIVFDSAAGAFTLNGNGLDFFGDITNASSNTQTVNLIGTGLTLRGKEQYFDGGSGGLVINSNVTFNGPGMDVAGMGWFWTERGLPATANFLFLRGKTTVNGTIGDAGGGGAPGVLVIQGGDGMDDDDLSPLDFSNAIKLTQANTHSGGTVVSGALEFSQGSLGNGPLSIDGGGLKWATGNTQDISSLFVTKMTEVQLFGETPIGWGPYSEELSVASIWGGAFDTNGQDIELKTAFYAQGLIKQGLGTLTLSGRGGAKYLTVHEGVLNLAQSVGTGGLGDHGSFAIVNVTGGLLRIGAGAQINSDGAFIGSEAGKSGGVEVDFGDWRLATAVYIGTAGSGSLSVGMGGIVETGMGVLLARDAGSQGAMTVDGGLVNATTGMIVGSNGTANVVIKNGATVNVGEFSWASLLPMELIEGLTESAGVLLEIDPQEIMNVFFKGSVFPDKFYIGGNPEGSFMGNVGLNAGVTGSGTMTVQGGSRLTAGTETFVGYTGNGVLNVESLSEMVTGNVDIGGTKATYQEVTHNGTTYLTLSAFGNKGTGTVRIDNATWLADGMLTVGSGGTGTLEVRNGGQVLSETSVIGSEPGGVGSAMVTGTNSGWIVAGELRVGGGSQYQLIDRGSFDLDYSVVPLSDGFSGSLTVQNGGLVVAGEEISVAYGRQSTGVATVNGGTLTTGTNLHVGRSGTGTLNVGLDGRVHQAAGILGTEAAGFGTANVTGGMWSGSSLTVGRAGQGILNVSGGLVSTGAITFGELAGSGGALNITSGTLQTTGNFIAGQAGNAALSIGGGLVSVGGYTEIARQAGKTVAVEMTGGGWANTGNFSLGTYGTGNFTMSGGHLSTDGAYIGDQNTGVGNLTVVSGTFQAFNLYIGSAGTGSLAVSNTGVVKAIGTTLGNYTDSDGTVTLSGNPLNRGMLETGSLSKGSGNGSFVFDGGVLRAGRHNSNMVTGFAAGEIDIRSGGAFIDSNGFYIGIGAVLSGSGALIKQGAAELTLSASNSYTGGTVVKSGGLVITDLGNTASVLGSGVVIIETGGTLKGTGTVLGDTTVHGTLAPGNSPGVMHFAGALSLGDTATTSIELASPFSFDQLSIDGTLSYGGTLSLTLLGDYRPEVDDSFALFFANNVVGGTAFDNIIFDVAGYAALFDYETGQLMITSVPEPSALVLGLAGVAAVLAACRRRHRADRAQRTRR